MTRPDAADPDRALYPVLEELDRLEELLEEMTELGVTSIADIERRLADLNARIDEAEKG